MPMLCNVQCSEGGNM